MRIREALEDYLIEIEVRRYTPKTIRNYRICLDLFLRFCEDIAKIDEVDEISPATVRQFTQHMSGTGHKGTYVNGLLKRVKSFITYCHEEGYGGYSTKGNFRWVKEEKPVILAFQPEHVKSILRDCSGNDFVSVRDRAILTTFFETGIRCWELCCIQPEDIHDDYIVIVSGKGHKQRVVPITAVLRKELLRYERVKANYFDLKVTDHYFYLSFHGRQLTDSAIEHIVKRHSSGIQGIRASPHTCRHTFAQQQLRMGTDLYTISRLLGHENLQITQRYLESLRNEDVIEETKHRSVIANIDSNIHRIGEG